MNNNDKQTFAETLKSAAIAYREECPKELLSVYFDLLEDYTVEQVKVAVKAHCKGTGYESKFFPKASDIICRIVGSDKENKLLIEATAQSQWQTVFKCISKYGRNQKPKFKDVVTSSCVNQLGWVNICSKTIEELTWIGKDFIAMYQSRDKVAVFDVLENKESSTAKLRDFSELKQIGKNNDRENN